ERAQPAEPPDAARGSPMLNERAFGGVRLAAALTGRRPRRPEPAAPPTHPMQPTQPTQPPGSSRTEPNTPRRLPTPSGMAAPSTHHGEPSTDLGEQFTDLGKQFTDQASSPDTRRRRQAISGRHRRAPEERASYAEVFAIGEFRAMWAAQILSAGGDQFAQVAIAILVYHRTHSPFLTALAYALTYLPPIIGGPFLSGLADLFPRRRVMIVSDLFRVGTVGLMAVPGLPFAALCGLLFCTVLTGV